MAPLTAAAARDLRNRSVGGPFQLATDARCVRDRQAGRADADRLADATRPLPFADAEFDLAFCNSVIEHVPFARRVLLAAEICRVARGWWVQTPAYGFPVEPHALLPLAHGLPRPLRRLYWQVGVAGEWEEIGLLRQSDLLGLFGPPVIAERVGPAAKSWIAIRVPASGGPPPLSIPDQPAF